MKTFAILLIFLCLGISATAQGKSEEVLKNEIKKIKSKPAWAIKYDKFDDITGIYLGGWNIGKSIGARRCDVFTGFAFPGETLTEPPKEFFIVFAVFPNLLGYRSNESKIITSELKFLADKDRLAFASSGEDSMMSELLSGGTAKSISSRFKISRSEYEKISKASSVSLRLGSSEIELNQKQIALFSEVLKLSDTKK
jgi:hypothetical protein